MSGVAQLGILCLVVADEGVQVLFVLLDYDVTLRIHSVEVANEGHSNLTLSTFFTSNRRLVLENHPVVLRVSDDIDFITEDIRLMRGGDIFVRECPGVASELLVLDRSRYFDTVILCLLLIVSENKAEFEVLLVGHLLSVEDEAAVELPDALIHFTVLLEELQLHSIALSIIDCACCNQIINLHISGLIKISSRFVAALEEGQGKLGELPDHYTFLFDC